MKIENDPTASTEPPSMPCSPVAWLHVMDNTEGCEESEPRQLLTFSAENPFGIPGQDYSAAYPVTSHPLYLANDKILP